MMAIGFPSNVMSEAAKAGFADCSMKELAGNAFACQVVAAVLLGLLVSIPPEWTAGIVGAGLEADDGSEAACAADAAEEDLLSAIEQRVA